MPGADITGNRRLARLAREEADKYPAGSLARCAAACVGDKTVKAARRCLVEDLADEAVRQAALTLLDRLVAEGAR